MQYLSYSREELIADGVVHVIGVVFGALAVIAMIVFTAFFRPLSITISLSIYGVALLAMFSASAAYNLNRAPRWEGLLRRFDHAAIFLKIAGTYTPFAVIMGGVAGNLLLTFVWVVALPAAAGKLIQTHWKGIDIAMYLALGWAGALVYQPLSQALPLATLILLGVGGVLYSTGVVFHLWRGLKYHNAIWNLFVLAATGCHFGAVTTAVFA